MKSPTSLSIAFVVICIFVNPVQADQLDLNLAESPDIFASFVDLTYNLFDSFLGDFSARGFAFTLEVDGVTHDILPVNFDPSFVLDAVINTSGNLLSGALTIGGTVSALGFNSGTLLTGNLTDFGFATGATGPLEFLFDVTDGDAAGLYGPTGGIIISVLSGDFPGNFSADFSAGSGAVTDIASVPEPSTALLLLTGLGALFAFRRYGAQES